MKTATANSQVAQDYPPLPDRMTPPADSAPAIPLAQGCYLINYAPFGAFNRGNAFEGTLRVETATGQPAASGDFYQREFTEGEERGFLPSPDPVHGIPVFPIGRYRYYLRATNIVGTDSGFDLTFEVHRFNRAEMTLLDTRTTHWVLEDVLTAHLSAGLVPSQDPIDDPAAPEDFPLPARFPFPGQFFSGPVTDRAGDKAGTFKMGQVSPRLRKATIEIDRVPDAEFPRDNQAGVTWKTVFDGLNWEVTVSESETDIAKPDGPVWKPADAEAAMHKHRDRNDLDAEWRYHILVVQLITGADSNFGVMYDHGFGREMTRQGLYIASQFTFPLDDPKWGPLRGLQCGATPAFFRTALHEMGHAMGLFHQNRGFSFMRPTEQIAEDAPASAPFPSNIMWSYHPDDEHRLRHWPDIAVRPGGVDLGGGDVTPPSII